MTRKAKLWHQAQEARAQARATRMARLDLLSRDNDAQEEAKKLARAAAECDRRAQKFVSEMKSPTDRPPVEIDWGDLTNYP